MALATRPANTDPFVPVRPVPGVQPADAEELSWVLLSVMQRV